MGPPAHRREGGGTTTVAAQVGQRASWWSAGRKARRGAPDHSLGWGGGGHCLEGGAAELADIASVATPKAAAAVLIHENDEALGKMPASILKVDEAGQDRVRLAPHANWTTLPYWAMWATSQSMLRAWVQPETAHSREGVRE